MRARAAIVVCLLLALAGAAPAAHTATSSFARGQEQPGGEDEEGRPGGEEEGEPGAETGAEEGQEEAPEEEGPIWTYQMVWLSLGLLVLFGLAAARWYYLLVGRRGREGA